MTLVAGLSIGGMPAFVGDLLLSWRLKTGASIPTRNEDAPYECADGQYIAGLAQKLVIVRAYLLVAWSGTYSEARRLIQELDKVLPDREAELHGYDVAFEILNTCAEGTELVALFITEKSVRPFGVRTRGFELDNRRIYLLGSGAAEFFEYLQQHAEVLPAQETPDGIAARAALLRFASQSLVFQWKVQTGLEHAWGGGFEIAYPTREGFKKIGNTLFRAWLVDEGGISHSSGRSFFSRYCAQDLHLSCFAPGDQTHIIPSLVGERALVPEFESVHPEWTLDTYFIKSTGAIVDFARYHPPHRPVKDVMRFAKGELVGWAMDREYVEQCARRAVVSSARGRSFEISRY